MAPKFDHQKAEELPTSPMEEFPHDELMKMGDMVLVFVCPICNLWFGNEGECPKCGSFLDAEDDSFHVVPPITRRWVYRALPKEEA